MAAPPPPPPARGTLSLYDNLHDPNDPTPAATISAAPVLYGQTDAASVEAKKSIDPALRFQPQIRRPPVKQAKSKATFPKALPKTTPTPASNTPAATGAPIPSTSKTSLADWAPTREDEWMYGAGERPQRGGRKKKRKKQQHEVEDINWDDYYDPGKPTNVEQYLTSEEKINEVLEWKALLYRHRKRQESSSVSSDEEEERGRSRFNQFAPPPPQAFAPPPPSPPRVPSDTTGDDAFARRMALSSNQPPSALPEPSPPPPPPASPLPSMTSATISRAPVRYIQPEDASSHSSAAADVEPADTRDQPRSKAPGQAGFAHRLMAKYGWTAGTGLGADETGIVNPLRVQVEKRRKKADADGGGWAEPGGKGKILGGKRKGDQGSFGKMSEVIVLRNMLENLPDLQKEVSDGLAQEIGEECGEKYGRVERLYIDLEARQVFIKFTDQVSALRAVNELDGRVFNGNTITPKFYDAEKFERGIYLST
ncbi:hypothetical protein HIM_04397 [Hirsutella minnesotensis 3608]|uniref:G-patch domain-containing protein n=1 Tax=Hirsutella minnesotensis 3608 TaxID=1043627 RepID=A0A0F7ZPY6_9HYPO|nr:hypothetical protein HIM_04397 [Hirsutella minnesotensis 3608]